MFAFRKSDNLDFELLSSLNNEHSAGNNSIHCCVRCVHTWQTSLKHCMCSLALIVNYSVKYKPIMIALLGQLTRSIPVDLSLKNVLQINLSKLRLVLHKNDKIRRNVSGQWNRLSFNRN